MFSLCFELWFECCCLAACKCIRTLMTRETCVHFCPGLQGAEFKHGNGDCWLSHQWNAVSEASEGDEGAPGTKRQKRQSGPAPAQVRLFSLESDVESLCHAALVCLEVLAVSMVTLPGLWLCRLLTLHRLAATPSQNGHPTSSRQSRSKRLLQARSRPKGRQWGDRSSRRCMGGQGNPAQQRPPLMAQHRAQPEPCMEASPRGQSRWQDHHGSVGHSAETRALWQSSSRQVRVD